ncbi:hypothetical protein ABH979_007372 [Bradyrhizobium ottawaense]
MRPILSDSMPNTMKKPVPSSSDQAISRVGGVTVDLQDRLQEEQRVELAGVPDDALAHHAAEQREQHELAVLPVAEGFGQRRLRALALVLHLLEDRGFIEAKPDPDRDAEQQHRDQERDAPAPRREVGLAEGATGEQDHQQRQEQAERRGGLNEGGVVAALAVRSMFRDVGRRAAILTAERQALGEAQRDQDDRSRDADGGRVRQQADDEGRQTHDQDGDEEGIFAADDVADAAEHDRAERTHQEAGCERQQREDVAGCRRIGREELRADDAGQRTVEVEIVPLEDGTERGGENDEPFVLRHPSRACLRYGHCRHVESLPELRFLAPQTSGHAGSTQVLPAR